MIRKLRIASQGLFLFLFLYLLARTQYPGTDEIRLPVKIFVEADPLAGLSTWLASGHLEGFMWLGLVVLGLSFFLGRFFCGWVCPLGALIQLSEYIRRRRRAEVIASNQWSRWQSTKFYLLAVLLAGAVLGIHWTGVFDPIPIAIRSLGMGLFPVLESVLRWVFDFLYARDPLGSTAVSEPVFEYLQGRVIGFEQPVFGQAAFFLLILIGVLALGLIKYRFWCRYLCPLGALLGLVARLGAFRIKQSEGCTGCHLCTFNCQGAAEPEKAGLWRPSECLVCGNCTASCPESALTMGFAVPRLFSDLARLARALPALLHRRTSGTRAGATESAGTGVSRRYFGYSLLAGLGFLGSMRVAGAHRRSNPLLIRPPGARSEREFLDLCIRCGECMKVCLTNALQPTFLEAGLEGIWTPRLVPTIGYCEYDCTLCGQVCPTQAIRRLDPEEKKRVRIGLATIDTSRCLPYAFQQNCIVCEEHCPLPRKAIWFEEVLVVTHDGAKRLVKQPHVDPELCTGCGICENKCVLRDRPAIRVTSANEDRNPWNRVLLGLGGGTKAGALGRRP